MEEIEKYNDGECCWWCNSFGELTGEHKEKKTDLELLFGNNRFIGEYQLGLIQYRTNNRVKNIQGSNQPNLKFPKNICKTCNNQKSQSFDKAYEKFIKHYHVNKSQIKRELKIDLSKVFGDTWKGEIENVYKYIIKHFICRLVTNGFKPSKNLINYLDGKDKLKDFKIVFQLKPYKLVDEIIYLGPFNFIKHNIPTKGSIITSVSGWYTFNNLTFNYLFEKNIFEAENIPGEILTLEQVDYKKMNTTELKLEKKSFFQNYGQIIEKLEYFPFEDNKEVEHYKYLKKFKHIS